MSLAFAPRAFRAISANKPLINGAISARRNVAAMAVSTGDKLPSIVLYGSSPKDEVELSAYVAGKTVVMFGVPGAFTPGCSKTHLPGYISMAEDFKAAGVDEIICTSVNDAFVMTAWGEAQGAAGKVTMLADTQSNLARALDIVLDAEGALGSKRMKRFSMLLKDGEIKLISVESDGTGLACSLAETTLDAVKSA